MISHAKKRLPASDTAPFVRLKANSLFSQSYRFSVVS
jgi:hypothetical protein